ncbi:hypothetical protein [Geotalea toluenoxydans]|uniref:hypothetical protein n=1 Tax=Geotalea toluenoxydans TaxID=421624 RepID=UPI0006D0E543|nr:hypothetical protein [Geotalea toluenoxydans]
MKVNSVIVLAIMFFLPVALHAADVQVSVGEVKDSRSTSQFLNELEIKLKLTGDDVPSIRGVKTTFTTAIDGTGRSILKKEGQTASFEPFRDAASGLAEVTLKLKNPARKAAVVSELSGELQLFMPERDPASIVVVKGFLAKAGKPLGAVSLAKARVEVTVLTKADYNATVKRQEEERVRAEGAKEGLSGAMMQMVEGFMGMFLEVGEHDVIFKLADPAEKLIDIEVLDGKGNVMQTQGR